MLHHLHVFRTHVQMVHWIGGTALHVNVQTKEVLSLSVINIKVSASCHIHVL